MNVIEHSLAQAKSVMERYLSDPDTVRNIAKASEFMADAIRNGGKVISCGNPPQKSGSNGHRTPV